MNKLASGNSFEEIQSVCRDFRPQLKQREQAQGERNHNRAENAAREMLFPNRLQLEIRFEFHQGSGRSLLGPRAVTERGREENRGKAIRLLKELESVIPRAESWLLDDNQHDEVVVASEDDVAAWEAEFGSLTHPEEDAQ